MRSVCPLGDGQTTKQAAEKEKVVFSRVIGGAIGALVTFALLWLNHADPGAWATAAIVGAAVTVLWPIVMGFYFGRRHARSRRENDIEAEVQRRIARAQTEDIPPR
jgi:phosphotransferase system  glucose/maltose/N-acetylglucosamine-specific IIC component